MRVVIATAFPDDPDSPCGGVEAVSVTLIKALAARGNLELHVVTVRRQESAAAVSSWNGATLHRLGRRGGHLLTSALGPDRRMVMDYVDRLSPDLVHAHDTYGLMIKGLPGPRVLTIHGFIHEDTRLSQTRFARIRSAAWRYVERAAWADYPHIISISPYVRERLTGIATGTIHDVDNPVDRRFFDVRRSDSPSPVIFSAAVISRRKNTLGLVDAFSRLAGCGARPALRLAGAVREPDYYRLVIKRLEEHQLGKDVDLLGPIDTAAVRHQLGQASIFALVSREENSPLGIQEAMAAGIPVVASNRCGMPYLIRNGDTGFLVDPEDPNDIADRLTVLIGDPELRAAMGERARQTALDRFHPDAVARRTCAIYEHAVSRHSPRRERSPAVVPG